MVGQYVLRGMGLNAQYHPRYLRALLVVVLHFGKSDTYHADSISVRLKQEYVGCRYLVSNLLPRFVPY